MGYVRSGLILNEIWGLCVTYVCSAQCTIILTQMKWLMYRETTTECAEGYERLKLVDSNELWGNTLHMEIMEWSDSGTTVV